MKIQEIPISQIKIGERFRKDLGNVDELSHSILHTGLIQPITVDTDFNLLAGGRRLAACRLAGLSTIPVIVRHVDGKLDAREVELFENIHRKDMTWPEQANLTKCIHEMMLEKHGKPTGGGGTQTGWTAKDTAGLIGRSRQYVQDALSLADALEVVPELASQPTADKARRKLKRVIKDLRTEKALKAADENQYGNVMKWASKHYEIGDALQKIKRTPQGSAHFAEVDPPYAIDLANKRDDQEPMQTYLEVHPDDYPTFIREIAFQTFRVLAKDAWCVWWFGPTWHHVVKTILIEAGFKVNDVPSIWFKIETPTSSNSPNIHLSYAYEPFFVCRKGNPRLQKSRTNVFVFPGVPTTQRIHATERPVPLIREILSTFVPPGSRLIVPFLGSGNTLIAGYHERMVGRGWDLSEEHRLGFLGRVQDQFPEDFNIE